MSKHDTPIDDTNPFRVLQKRQFRDARTASAEKKPEPARHSVALPDDESEAFAAAMGGVQRLDAPSGKAPSPGKGGKTNKGHREGGASGTPHAPQPASGAVNPATPTGHEGTPRARDAHGRPTPAMEAALRDKAGIQPADEGSFALGQHPAFKSLRENAQQADADVLLPEAPHGQPIQGPASHPDVKTSQRRLDVRERSRHAVSDHGTQHPTRATSGDDDDDMSFATAMRGITPLSGKGREVPPAVTPGKAATSGRDPVQDFLEGRIEFALEYTEEYLEGHVVGLDELTIGKLRAGQYSPEAHLDLHGLNALQAYQSLVGFFRGAYLKGLRTVLVIPGRGRNSPDGLGILREKLQSWLTRDPFKRVVLAFCTAQPTDGGAGAVYVLLRKFKKSRGKIQWDRTPSDADLFM